MHSLIPLPIPAAIYGLVLLFAALKLRVIKVEQIKETAAFFIALLPILFVPSIVSLPEYFSAFSGKVIGIVVCIVVPIIITFAVAGIVTQRLINKKEGKK